jgi:hypothetical protein
MSAGPSRRHRCGGISLVDYATPVILAATPVMLSAAVRPLGESIRWCILALAPRRRTTLRPSGARPW